MPSHSLLGWTSVRCEALDEIENAHASIGGIGRGRRFATQQINQAYAVMLASQFQGFCRDLHTECVDHLIPATPLAMQMMIRMQFVRGRALDRGNPNPGNLGSDYGRFGFEFWQLVNQDHHQNERRQQYLEELNTWRNAIAHQDFDPVRLGGTTILHLATVRQWRSSLNVLAQSFDRVMFDFLHGMLGTNPW